MFFLILYFLIKLNEVSSDNKPILIQLEAEQILNTFKTMMGSKYIANLTNEFATKAAQRFIEEIKNNEKQLTETKNTVDYRSPAVTHNEHQQPLLDDSLALTLMNEPLPDGDNLDEDNDSLLTDDKEEEKPKDPPPNIGGLKINGVYYRRFPKLFSNDYRVKSVIILD